MTETLLFMVGPVVVAFAIAVLLGMTRDRRHDNLRGRNICIALALGAFAASFPLGKAARAATGLDGIGPALMSFQADALAGLCVTRAVLCHIAYKRAGRITRRGPIATLTIPDDTPLQDADMRIPVLVAIASLAVSAAIGFACACVVTTVVEAHQDLMDRTPVTYQNRDIVSDLEARGFHDTRGWSAENGSWSVDWTSPKTNMDWSLSGRLDDPEHKLEATLGYVDSTILADKLMPDGRLTDVRVIVYEGNNEPSGDYTWDTEMIPTDDLTAEMLDSLDMDALVTKCERNEHTQTLTQNKK